MLAIGVNVAVQVIPPSLELTAVRVPLAIVRSALVNPVTASENVTVTSDVSPTAGVVSATTIVAVGAAAAAGVDDTPAHTHDAATARMTIDVVLRGARFTFLQSGEARSEDYHERALPD